MKGGFLFMKKEKEKQASEGDLKILFFDILKGHTKIFCDKGSGYIKHLTIFDSVTTDKEYKKSFERAVEMGIPKETEQIEYLIKELLWSQEKDRRIKELKSYLSNLEDTKSKLFLEADINQIKSQIQESKQEYESLIKERSELIGMTAEYIAEKKSNESYIQKIVYKDNDYKDLFFSEEDFDELTDIDLIKIYSQYKDSTIFLNTNNIKKISLSYFFVNSFYLCEDNPYTYFGKPVVNLTFYQNELFSYGRYFKSMQQDSEIKAPKEIQNDPDALMEFYEGRKNAKETLSKMEKGKGSKGAGASTIVGATQKDLEKLGYKANSGKTIDLAKEADKKGGVLSMDDFIQLHT